MYFKKKEEMFRTTTTAPPPPPLSSTSKPLAAAASSSSFLDGVRDCTKSTIPLKDDDDDNYNDNNNEYNDNEGLVVGNDDEEERNIISPTRTVIAGTRTTTTTTNNNNVVVNDTTTTTTTTTNDDTNVSINDTTTTNRILSKMTLRDKIKLLTGASFWTTADISSFVIMMEDDELQQQSKQQQQQQQQQQSKQQYQITMCDGPHGIRKPLVETSLQKSYIATCYPAECAVACSWDETLVERIGNAVATEAKQRNVQLVLGPGLNIKRHPYNGRNFEYYSEDPLVSGRLASAMIRGIQSNGSSVGACCKHFAVNNQETNRFIINAIVDTRTLRELYFRAFEIICNYGSTNLNSNNKDPLNPKKSSKNNNNNNNNAVQQPAAIMGSYNKVNGIYVAENYNYITNMIRNEWNYNGILISDWGATDNRIASIQAGLDIEMPGSYTTHYETIVQYCKQYPDYEINYINPCICRIIQFIIQYTNHPSKTTTNTTTNATTKTSSSPTTTVGTNGSGSIAKNHPRVITGEEEEPQQQVQVDSRDHNNNNNNNDKNNHHNHYNILYPKNRHKQVKSDLPFLLSEAATDDILFDQNRIDEEEGTILVATSITTTTTTTTGAATAAAAATVPVESIVTDRTEIDLLEYNYRIAYEAALECCVLLKNNNNCLPLALPSSSSTDGTSSSNSIIISSTDTTAATMTTNAQQQLQLPTVAIIGDFGKTHPRFQGMGSSQINPYKVSTVYEAILALYQKATTTTTTIAVPNNICSSNELTISGITTTATIPATPTNHHQQQNQHHHTHEKLLFAPGYDLDDDHEEDIHEGLLQEALDVAEQAEIILVCIGLPEIMESEGVDRVTHTIPAQHTALVTEIGKQRQQRRYTSQTNNPIQKLIVLLYNGSSIDVSSWEQYPDAIVEGYLLGSAGGEALVDIIYGKAVPCGKLAESFPRSVESSLQVDRYFPGTRDRVEHREGLNIGYRQPVITTTDGTVLNAFVYPFGHGLSYTTFEYSNLQSSIVLDTQDDIIVQVTFQVTNTGTVYTAKEIIQCYIHDVTSTVYRPEHELKDFIKITLRPLETQTVQLTLTKDSFAFYDIGYEKWIVEEGNFEIRIASSSTDIRLRETIYLQADHTTASAIAVEAYPSIPTTFSQSESIPSTATTTTSTKLQFNKEDPQSHHDTSTATMNTTATTTAVTTSNWYPEVDDITFAKRFGINCEQVLNEIRESKSVDPHLQHYYGKVHRNTLIKEIAHRKVLGYVFYTFASRAVVMDLDRTSHSYKRQRYMMLRNFDNIPLRALVLFSRGTFSYQLLDTIIYFLNATVWDVTKSIFQSVKNLFTSSTNSSNIPRL